MTTAKVLPLTSGPTLADAAAAFLNRRDLDGDTLRSYRQTLTRLCTELGRGVLLTDLTAEQTAAVFATAWGTRPPVPGTATAPRCAPSPPGPRAGA
ncbi:hypothetical protein [Nonomuraea terrae]|uniref:hypothetical protein n=1 Tax=Nonomuraea terrae TaxID=2530383 RepID=UPI001FE4B46E|nr:hypothetical protein [Nonomuraea terrae]